MQGFAASQELPRNLRYACRLTAEILIVPGVEHGERWVARMCREDGSNPSSSMV